MDPHQPTNGSAAVDRKLWVSAALNSAITLAEFIGGFLSGSLALLSDAVHNASDVLSLGMGCYGLCWKPFMYCFTPDRQ